jgi:hypothetical protein
MPRDEKGRYKFTGDTNSNYFYGKDGHRAIWIKENGPIPKGYVIHHINGDKKENRIENLEMMTFTRHNNIHRHTPWNKGKHTNPDTQKKMLDARHKSHLETCIETLRLKNNKYKLREIAEIQGISRRQVSDRINYARRFTKEETAR